MNEIEVFNWILLFFISFYLEERYNSLNKTKWLILKQILSLHCAAITSFKNRCQNLKTFFDLLTSISLNYSPFFLAQTFSPSEMKRSVYLHTSSIYNWPHSYLCSRRRLSSGLMVLSLPQLNHANSECIHFLIHW